MFDLYTLGFAAGVLAYLVGTLFYQIWNLNRKCKHLDSEMREVKRGLRSLVKKLDIRKDTD